ncbi:phage tail tube protein [Streptomyces sp. WZ-12]|uniref:phage tail tube protein n=1 Tax=Streptomyces sp. WZ-12 TaxID=3030210 RepID=UPI0023811747|nr:hypothetical protein [Streptomyces sp. WZ-12]
MAENNSKNIRFAPHGRIAVGTYGSATAPKGIGEIDPETGLPKIPDGFHALGYATTEGVDLTPKIETQSLEAWQSATPVMYSVKSASLQLKSTLMEVNPTVTSLYFGAEWQPVEGNADEYVLDLASSPDLSQIVVIVDWADKDVHNRLVIPHAIVSDRDAIKLNRTDNESFGITIDALDENGSLGQYYTDANMLLPTVAVETPQVKAGGATAINGREFDKNAELHAQATKQK